MQCAAVGFVDDNDVIEDGEKVNEDMQIMLNKHNDLHAATGRHIEEEKTKYYALKQRWKQGVKVLKKIPTELWLNNKKIDRVRF